MNSTNLLNLAKIGQLEPVPPSAELVRRMLASARQRLRDAEITQNSSATRFDCAYNAIRAVADVGLHIHGFRTSTSKPGHHQTAIQSLTSTLDVDASAVRMLDAMRKQRNSSNYDGEPVTEAALNECMKQARAVVARLEVALRANPDFASAVD